MDRDLAKTCLRAFADSEGPDQTARMHPRSLICAFVVHKESLGTTEHNYSKTPDQTIYVRWLILIFSVCIYPEVTFSRVTAPINVLRLMRPTNT